MARNLWRLAQYARPVRIPGSGFQVFDNVIDNLRLGIEQKEVMAFEEPAAKHFAGLG
jgi:hypothetical protein